MADMLQDDNDIPSILLPCVSCNRTFRPEALAKHSKFCEKTLMKKRKKFDSSKQRIQGTDLAEFLPVLPTFTKKTEKSPVRKIQTHSTSSGQLTSSSKSSLTSPKQENTKWREKHNELVQTIKAARMPPGQAPIIKPSDHETCPYCERSFGPKAYDRHLEWCKEQKHRVQPKSPASQRAKERLEARTKYRAPPVGKTKRSASRDKMSSESSPHVASTPLSVRKRPTQTNLLESSSSPSINQSFVKGTPLRSSTRGGSSYRTPQSTSYPSENMDKQHSVDLHSISQSGGPDSAYSSLNRKSPVGGEQEREPEGSAVAARFCHECGAKYPVIAAKFCCQCGVRRLVI